MKKRRKESHDKMLFKRFKYRVLVAVATLENELELAIMEAEEIPKRRKK